MLRIKTKTSPTLAAGAFTQAFGEFEKVNYALAVLDKPATAASGVHLALRTAVSGVTVTVTVEIVTLTEAVDASRVYAAAVTGDVTGLIFIIVADGE